MPKYTTEQLKQTATRVVEDFFTNYRENEEFGIDFFLSEYDHSFPRIIRRNAEREGKDALEYLLSLVEDPELQQWAFDTLYTRNYRTVYQTRGALAIVDNKRFLIADQVGTGKTLQGVMAKLALDEILGRRTKTLVVCPGYIKSQWREKVQEYTSEPQKVIVINGYNQDVERRLAECKETDVDYVIISYELFSGKNGKRLSDKLLEVGFDYAILDEVHHMKNPRSTRSEGKHGIKSESRLKAVVDKIEYLCMLSGTPTPNSFKDAYILISMLYPEIYPDSESVRRSHQSNPEMLGGLLRNRMERRKAEDVLDMTGKLDENYFEEVELNERQREVYNAILNYNFVYGTDKLNLLRKALLDPSLLKGRTQGRRVRGVINRIFRDKPELYASLDEIESSKYSRLDELVRELVEKGEKVVIFTTLFKEGVTEKLQERYKGYGALRIDGDITGEQRRNVRREFQTDSEKKVLIATTRTTGEGISLTAAQNIIFLDEPYTSTEREQGIGRVYRRGQRKDVKVCTLIAKNSVDEGVRILQVGKAEGIRKFVDGESYEEVMKYKDILAGNVENQGPIVDKIYTDEQRNRQKLFRYFVRMTGRGFEDNLKFAQKSGEELAELFFQLWQGSQSENASKVYKEIIQGLERSEDLNPKVDLASGPAVFSRVSGEPVVNLDMIGAHFKYAREMTHPDNAYVTGLLHALPFADKQFKFALCSLALHHTRLEKVDKEGNEFREREMALREANRILQPNGYYLLVIPYRMIIGREERFNQGLSALGFDVIPELTGHVMATEPEDSEFRTYIVTARKVREPAEVSTDYLAFNTDFARMGKGRRHRLLNPMQQSTLEICEKFAFYDPVRGLEDVEKRVEEYTKVVEKPIQRHPKKQREPMSTFRTLGDFRVINNLIRYYNGERDIPDEQLARLGYEKKEISGKIVIRPKR